MKVFIRHTDAKLVLFLKTRTVSSQWRN